MTTKRQVRAVKPLAKPLNLRFRMVGETISELKKVVWPSRQEAANLTMIVIIVSVAVGLILGVIDFTFSWLVNTILLGGR